MRIWIAASIVLSACGNDMPELPLIPLPVSVQSASGQFSTSSNVFVAISDPDNEALPRIAGMLRAWPGVENVTIGTIGPTQPTIGTVELVLDEQIPHDEGYRLTVSDERVTVTGRTPAGVFYGVQTLAQLWPGPGASIPAVTIEDQPRFSYRGMHLDVGRHYFPVEFVKKYIDTMAGFKLNTFHWHLTEDQGWRIEIKQYPRLTEVGAFRSETILEKNFDPYIGDGIPHGGYYTQNEVRDVVAYAAERFITVIPEIELPGHSVAALAAYPELACTPGPFEVHTIWGVNDNIYCPHERTFTFLENVLTEVLDMFPSRYIHIGGDEAPKTRWEESDDAQAVIDREGLADEHELQSYFIRRIERFLLEHDRRLIGWDEILEGGLAPEATVMSWRGMDGGIAAARQGHDVIMTPTSHTYLDYYQGAAEFEPLAIGGLLPLDKVYAFEPVPEVLTPDEANHILGAQGNVWTEYMKTPEHVEYMAFPRALALAEVLWSPLAQRNWESFAARLPAGLRQLDRAGVNYRVPHVEGLETDIVTLDPDATVSLKAFDPAGTIRYTVDGMDPTETATEYTGPFVVPAAGGTTLSARLFLEGGRTSPVARARVEQTELRPAGDIAPDRPGLDYRYFGSAQISSVTELNFLTPTTEGSVQTVSLPDQEPDETFGMTFQGFIQIPDDAVYSFTLTSDDGSTLELAGETVIDHDGFHGASSRTTALGLAAGWHRITVRYFQGGGGATLSLSVQRDGVPASVAYGH